MSMIELVRKDIAALAGPLKAHLEILDQQIETQESELSELKATRTQLQRALKSIDPESVPQAKAKAKTKGIPNAPSEEKLRQALRWLQANRAEVNGNGGFYASGLERAYGSEGDGTFPIKGNSSIAVTLRILHEQGVIRLVRTGSGGSKYYEVV